MPLAGHNTYSLEENVCCVRYYDMKGITMENIRLVDIREFILSDNQNDAEKIRDLLAEKKIFLINLMSSPGSGKTSLIIQTVRQLKSKFKFGIIEGDIESTVDAEKVASEGVQAVQITTGGMCHLDASMISIGLEKLDLSTLDIVIIENIGNLVCPAEFDLGENLKVMILSVPEGDDKILKYPMMFSVCDVLIINKADYLPDDGFDMEFLIKKVKNLNPNIEIMMTSCRTGAGIEAWAEWLASRVVEYKSKR